MSARLPQITHPLKDKLHIRLFSYINELSNAKILYPLKFTEALQALLDSSEKCEIKDAETWTTGVSYTFDLDSLLQIARLNARDIVGASSRARVEYIVGPHPDGESNMQDHLKEWIPRMIKEWETMLDGFPIIHETRFHVKNTWSWECSNVLGTIPIPHSADDLQWGTTTFNRDDTILYRGEFIDAGIHTGTFCVLPGDAFYFQTFGISLWVIWPDPYHRPDQVGLPKGGITCYLDFQWCLKNLNNPLVYFLTSGTSFAEAPRFRICYGSVAHVFAFTPCHLISVPAFGRSIFGNFVRIAEQLNEEITSGAFTLPFHQWLQLLRITGWGKKSWRYFFEGCSEAKHDILQATRFDAFKSCLNWDMVAGVLAGRVHIDPSVILPIFPLQWCQENASAETMGTADNAVVYALFGAWSPKRNSLHPWYFPVQVGWKVPTKTKQALCELVKSLNGAHAQTWPQTYHAYLEAVVLPLITSQVQMYELVGSEEFKRALFRYAQLRHSTRVRIGGRRLQGERTYEPCVIALEDFKKDEYIWELSGTYSSDVTESPAGYPVQWLVGPARLCSHRCRGNSVFVSLPNGPGTVSRTIEDIKAGEEITAQYRYHRCHCEACTETPVEYLGLPTSPGPASSTR